MKRILQTILIILLITFLIIQWYLHQKPEDSEKASYTALILDQLFSVVLIILTGIVVGAVLAAIPFRQHTYRNKFEITFPLATSLLLMILVAVFGYTLYLKEVKGVVLRPLHNYNKIEIPQDLDCSIVHEGDFESEQVYFRRTNDYQIQINKKTKERQEFHVVWLHHCEYELTPFKNPSDKIKVKITRADQNGYECYGLFTKYSDRYGDFIKVKRLRKNDDLFAPKHSETDR